MFSLFRNDLTDGGSSGCLPTSAPETRCMSWVGGEAVVTQGGSEGEGVVKLFS